MDMIDIDVITNQENQNSCDKEIESTIESISNGENQPWVISVDGSGVGIVIKSQEGTVIEQGMRLGFALSNN